MPTAEEWAAWSRDAQRLWIEAKAAHETGEKVALARLVVDAFLGGELGESLVRNDLPEATQDALANARLAQKVRAASHGGNS